MKISLLLAVMLALAPVTSAQDPRAFLDQYCVTCHNQRAQTAGLTLDREDVAHPVTRADIWERVIAKLRLGAMPPQGAKQPDPKTRDAVRAALENELDAAYAAAPHPGKAILHRLNRAEYGNAVRDLLGLEVNVESLLPADSSSAGFDNNAETLTVSPVLLEKYLAAGIKIADWAVGNPKIRPVSELFPIRLDHSQNQHEAGLPPGTRGGILVRYNFPADGVYQLKAQLYRGADAPNRGIEGRDTPTDFEILIDGVRVLLTQFGGLEDDAASYNNFARQNRIVADRMQIRVPIKAGPHAIGFTFLENNSAPAQTLFEPEPRTSLLDGEGGGPGQLESATITGPYEVTGVSETPSRARIFVCRPAVSRVANAASGDLACAKQIFTNLSRRAYRRPTSDADIETPLSLYQKARNQGGDFDAGIRAALPMILTSPSFLFRAESDPDNLPANAAHRVSDLELASRLSFFLWGSIPDEQLLNAAVQGKLHDSAVLERQTRRMLADRRSHEMIVNFTGQWLALRNLANAAPNVILFRDFDDILRQGFRTETEMFVESIVREDRGVLDLLNADYTFVNERLAKHYGMRGIYGDTFRRVPVIDENRRGLLGQASILTLTSTQIRTSPVKRGKWILTNLLNAPPPSPPPNVPALAENTDGGKARSIRERLEEHRKNPTCAACHRSIDPIGFTLENFDAIGAWRSTAESGAPVDASGNMTDGTVIDSPAGLRKAITSQPEIFVGTLTERLLTYALGRGVDYSDMPAVRAIYREAAKDNYRFSAIVLGVVKSVPFQMRTRPADSTQTASLPIAKRP